jgi:hypothetical protein
MSCDVWNRERDVLVDGCEESVCGSYRGRHGMYERIYTPSDCQTKAREEQQSDITSSDKSYKAQLDFDLRMLPLCRWRSGLGCLSACLRVDGAIPR